MIEKLLIVSGLCTYVLMYYYSCTIVKKFNKILEVKKIPAPSDFSLFLPQFVSRSNAYSLFILTNGPIRRGGYTKLLQGFKFRDEATLSEFLFSLILQLFQVMTIVLVGCLLLK